MGNWNDTWNDTQNDGFSSNNIESKWINVEDKLPPINEQVLIFAVRKANAPAQEKTKIAISYMKDSFYFTATRTYYNEPKWYNPAPYFLSDYTITHWMPMPRSPSDEQPQEDCIPPDNQEAKWVRMTGMMPPEFQGCYECSHCGGFNVREYLFNKPILPIYCPHCGYFMTNHGEE